MDENAYEQGNRAAWSMVLSMALAHLGTDGGEADRARWVKEREQTRAALMLLCAELDIDPGPEDLYLPDLVNRISKAVL